MKNKKFYLLLVAFAAMFAIMLTSCALIVNDTPTEQPSTDNPSEKSDNETPTIAPNTSVPTQPKPEEKPSEPSSTDASDTPDSPDKVTDNEQPTDSTDTTVDDPSEQSTEFTLTFYEENGKAEAYISDSTAIINTGKIYKIVKPGVYTISGKMPDGQIQVDVAKTEKVTLLLNNFDGACSDSAVIYVISADKVAIDLAKDSVNVVTDATTYVFDNPADNKPNACIYSSDDLTIKGGGTLYVNGRYNNGIGCKNDLEIKNGTTYISAVKNGLKGNDSVTICGDAVVNIKYANDAIKTDTPASEKPGKGYVTITEEAIVNVECDDEAIQATQNITITSGAILNVIKAKNIYKCDGTTAIDAGCIVTP